MISLNAFRESTKESFRGKGSDLKLIEYWLGESEKSQSQYNLINLVESCTRWIETKILKSRKNPSKAPSQLNQKRRGIITNLARDARDVLIKTDAFEKKKTSVASSSVPSGLASIKSGYGNERTAFQQFKAGTPAKGKQAFLPSGSFITTEMENFHRAVKNADEIPFDDTSKNFLSSVNFDQLTYSDYLKLHSFLAHYNLTDNATHVHFVRKDERIERLLTYCVNGIYYQKSSHPTQGDFLYVIDHYGNLLIQPFNQLINAPAPNSPAKNAPQSLRAQYNHSSLNAGNNIVCGGEIRLRQGKITFIDNSSGHYKPTAKQLQNAVTILQDDDGADLSLISIEAFTFSGNKQVVLNFKDVQAFLAKAF